MNNRKQILTKRRNYLIKLKVLYTTEYFDIFKMKKENIEKIERCDRLIQITSQTQH